MKKFLLFLMIFAVMLPVLSAPALADDEDNTMLSVTPYLVLNRNNMIETSYLLLENEQLFVNSQSGFDSTRQNGIYFSMADFYQSRYIFTVDISILGYRNNNISDVSGVLPLRLYVDYSKDNEQYVEFSRRSSDPLTYQADINGARFVIRVDHIDNDLTYHIYFYDYSTTHIYSNYFITFDLSGVGVEVGASIAGEFNIINMPLDSSNDDIISSLDNNTDDIIDAINKMAASSGASSSSISAAIQAQTGTIVQSQSDGFTALQTDVESLQAAVETFNDTMDEKLLEALEEYDKKESEKLTGELDGNVEDILNQLPLVDQQQNFTNATDAIISAVSDTSSDVTLTLPPGTVTIAGNTYTFWEEQTIDFNVWFQNEHIQLLLAGFRFLFAFGFVMYMLEWINKIISLILMEGTGTEVQEWRQESQAYARIKRSRRG